MMWTDLLVIDSCQDRNQPETPPQRGVGVFISPQSLVTFPVATSVVATLARASRTIARTEFDAIAPSLIAAFVVGSVIFAFTVSEHRSRPRTWATWLSAIATGFVNCLFLFVAALGIEKF